MTCKGKGLLIFAILAMMAWAGIHQAMPYSNSDENAERSQEIAITPSAAKVAHGKLQESAPRSTPKAAAPAAEQLVQVMADSVIARRQQDEMRLAVGADPHATPDLVIQAGRKLGEVADLEKHHPELKIEIQKFYLDCLEDSSAITVTRVQCIDHYVKSRDLSVVATEILIKDLPLSIRKLYGRFVSRS